MLRSAFLVFSNFLLMSVIFGDIFERTTFNVVLIPYANTKGIAIRRIYWLYTKVLKVVKYLWCPEYMFKMLCQGPKHFIGKCTGWLGRVVLSTQATFFWRWVHHCIKASYSNFLGLWIKTSLQNPSYDKCLMRCNYILFKLLLGKIISENH